MDLREQESIIKNLEEQMKEYIKDGLDIKIAQIKNSIIKQKRKAFRSLTSWDRVYLARRFDRPKAADFIENLFDDFIELHGDRCFGDDAALIGGIGYFHGIPVTVLAQAKGKDINENIKRNFGMSNPEGYRKALRLAKQAEKFKRPIITIVDTSGAYPGRGAEERGQAEAIAKCLYEFSALKTIVICVVIGEGGSGGALALSVGDHIIMLENAVYSVLSPEGFATILWKDVSRAKEASELMKLTADDLYQLNVVDEVIREKVGSISENKEEVFDSLDRAIYNALINLKTKDIEEIIENRYEKYRKIGRYK